MARTDSGTTGSVAQSGVGTMSQPMPSTLGASTMEVAQGPFIPPENVGGGFPAGSAYTGGGAMLSPLPNATSTVKTGDLPVLSSSTNSLGSPQAMPATQSLAPLASPNPVVVNAAVQSQPVLGGTGGDAYVHVIESGESLYTIARRYDVTTQSLVQANGLGSPDKIFVGQHIKIPGRPDLVSTQPKPIAIASVDASTQSPIVTPVPQQQSTAAIQDPGLLNSTTQPKPEIQQTAALPTTTGKPITSPITQAQQMATPAPVTSDTFKWPVSGRVITDFASSKATGINIEASEGTAVAAAENGTVIYVGSGVEGYGNLILIRHPNGYVSAYAHLSSMSVSKGQAVIRGQSIGATGMTGSVSAPQLHFELRKGATPVDPMPLLAS